jgi:adhesin transport system outer membrane protein
MAAQEQTRVAKGGYLPRIDVEAGVGKESNDYPEWDQNDFSRDRVSFSLNQMLYDGFLTRNEVRRLDLAARTRYYEVLNASEVQTALTARTYYDVLRHRALVDLSQENYATHRMIYEQIERRVKAGISRRVDLEQAAGRLALAESNLLTDVTNLYDVGMRYQRVVGEAPAPALEEPEITPNLLPATLKETLANAYVRSPLMNAAIANVWSANAAVDVQKSSMLPRIDVRARQDVWHDKDNIDGRTEEGVVELVMTYNIYNGGSDAAEKRRLLQKSNQAVDLRVKTCRDIRQEVSIAYNDLHQIEEQKIYLDRHQLSIAKAREAYRRQFDIGQRTLLDMLDTENEYYEARRAYINAERDQQVAYSRALAGIGGLVEALELGYDLHQMKGPPGTAEDVPDMYAVCPPEESGAVAVDKEALFREAIQKQGGRMPLQDPRPPEPLPYQKGGEFEPAPETAPAPDEG